MRQALTDDLLGKLATNDGLQNRRQAFVPQVLVSYVLCQHETPQISLT